MMYNCEHCGCCCRNLDKSDIYISLDRGDGVCRYLVGNDCSIYKDRQRSAELMRAMTDFLVELCQEKASMN